MSKLRNRLYSRTSTIGCSGRERTVTRGDADIWQNAALPHSSRNKAGTRTVRLAIENTSTERYHILRSIVSDKHARSLALCLGYDVSCGEFKYWYSTTNARRCTRLLGTPPTHVAQIS